MPGWRKWRARAIFKIPAIIYLASISSVAAGERPAHHWATHSRLMTSRLPSGVEVNARATTTTVYGSSAAPLIGGGARVGSVFVSFVFFCFLFCYLIDKSLALGKLVFYCRIQFISLAK